MELGRARMQGWLLEAASVAASFHQCQKQFGSLSPRTHMLDAWTVLEFVAASKPLGANRSLQGINRVVCVTHHECACWDPPRPTCVCPLNAGEVLVTMMRLSVACRQGMTNKAGRGAGSAGLRVSSGTAADQSHAEHGQFDRGPLLPHVVSHDLADICNSTSRAALMIGQVHCSGHCHLECGCQTYICCKRGPPTHLDVDPQSSADGGERQGQVDHCCRQQQAQRELDVAASALEEDLLLREVICGTRSRCCAGCRGCSSIWLLGHGLWCSGICKVQACGQSWGWDPCGCFYGSKCCRENTGETKSGTVGHRDAHM